MFKKSKQKFSKSILTTTIFGSILLSAVTPILVMNSSNIKGMEQTNKLQLFNDKQVGEKQTSKAQQIIGGWTQDNFGSYLSFLNNSQNTINIANTSNATRNIEINNQKFIDDVVTNETLKSTVKNDLVNKFRWESINKNPSNLNEFTLQLKRGVGNNIEITEVLTFPKTFFYEDVNNNYPLWSEPSATETEFQIDNGAFNNEPAVSHLTLPNLLFGEGFPLNEKNDKWFKIENNQLIGDYKKLGINILQTVNSVFFNNTINSEIDKGSQFNCDVIFKWNNDETFENKLKKYGLDITSSIIDLIKVLGNYEFSNSITMEVVFEVMFQTENNKPQGKRMFWTKLEKFQIFNLNLSTDKTINQIDNIKLFLTEDELKQINFKEEVFDLGVRSYTYYDGRETGFSGEGFLRRLGVTYQPNSIEEPFKFDPLHFGKWRENLEKEFLQKYYSIKNVEDLPKFNWNQNGSPTNSLPKYTIDDYKNNISMAIVKQYGFLNQNTLMFYYQDLWNILKKQLTELTINGNYTFEVTKRQVDGKETDREVITCRQTKQWKPEIPPGAGPTDPPPPPPPDYQHDWQLLTDIYRQITLNEKITTDIVASNDWINGFEMPQPIFKEINGENKLDVSLSVFDSNFVSTVIWTNVISFANEPSFKGNFIGDELVEDKDTFILLRDKLLINVSDRFGGIYKNKYLMFDNLEPDNNLPTLFEFLKTKYGTITDVVLPDWVGYVVGISISLVFLVSLLTVFSYMKLKKPPKDILDLKIIKKIK